MEKNVLKVASYFPATSRDAVMDSYTSLNKLNMDAICVHLSLSTLIVLQYLTTPVMLLLGPTCIGNIFAITQQTLKSRAWPFRLKKNWNHTSKLQPSSPRAFQKEKKKTRLSSISMTNGRLFSTFQFSHKIALGEEHMAVFLD